MNPPSSLRIYILFITAALLMGGLSSCSLFHNENDWAFNKGTNHVVVPQEVTDSTRR